ncbi:hypothetical protein U1Q18_021257 [Sarracenia purpurea var. burkii]
MGGRPTDRGNKRCLSKLRKQFECNSLPGWNADKSVWQSNALLPSCENSALSDNVSTDYACNYVVL